MDRLVDYSYSSAIGYAFGLLPDSISNKLRYIHFLTGTDPIYAGLHSYSNTKDNRSYRDTAHVVYPWHCLRKNEATTIVLPLLSDASPYTIIHELGHCLDEILGFRHTALPINKYAKTNRREAFAESFTAQYFWLGDKANDIFMSDKPTQYLFTLLSEEVMSNAVWSR